MRALPFYVLAVGVGPGASRGSRKHTERAPERARASECLPSPHHGPAVSPTSTEGLGAEDFNLGAVFITVQPAIHLFIHSFTDPPIPDPPISFTC